MSVIQWLSLHFLSLFWDTSISIKTNISTPSLGLNVDTSLLLFTPGHYCFKMRLSLFLLKTLNEADRFGCSYRLLAICNVVCLLLLEF